MLSDFVEVNPRVRNRDVGLANLDADYKPISDLGQTNKVEDVLREVKQALGTVEWVKGVKNNGDLFKQLDKYVDKESNRLCKNIGNLPIKYIQQLSNKGYISLTSKSKNTIDELIAEDVERSKPKEK